MVGNFVWEIALVETAVSHCTQLYGIFTGPRANFKVFHNVGATVMLNVQLPL
jgi:hypothetical protein